MVPELAINALRDVKDQTNTDKVMSSLREAAEKSAKSLPTLPMMGPAIEPAFLHLQLEAHYPFLYPNLPYVNVEDIQGPFYRLSQPTSGDAPYALQP